MFATRRFEDRGPGHVKLIAEAKARRGIDTRTSREQSGRAGLIVNAIRGDGRLSTIRLHARPSLGGGGVSLAGWPPRFPIPVKGESISADDSSSAELFSW